MIDVARLKSVLGKTGLQNTNQPLYQLLATLISGINDLNANITKNNNVIIEPSIVTQIGNIIGGFDDLSNDNLIVPASFDRLVLQMLSVDSPTLFVDSINHRVGINTLTPDNILVVEQPTTSNIKVRSTGAVGVGRAFIQVVRGIGVSSDIGWDFSTNLSLANNEFTLRQITSGSATTRLTMNTDGSLTIDSPTFFVDALNHRVGVGVIIPNFGLEVQGPGNTQLFSFAASSAGTSAIYGGISNTGGSLLFGVDRSIGGWFMTGGLAYASEFTTSNATALQFGTNLNARMTIDAIGQVGINITGPTALFSVAEKFQVDLNGLIPKYNNIATVKNGIPSEYAAIDTTGLTANVGASTLYAVPSTGEGLYRISAYVVETTAGSLSSTLPNVQIIYTDKDSNTSVTIDATPVLAGAGLGQSAALGVNAIGTVSSGVIVIYVKASTTIQYQTVNYASNLAGMTYALHIRLEAM